MTWARLLAKCSTATHDLKIRYIREVAATVTALIGIVPAVSTSQAATITETIASDIIDGYVT